MTAISPVELGSEPTRDEATPNDWAAVGRAIRERRLASGLTLVELASRVGLSQPFLSQIENGRARLSMKSLYRIARQFDTTPQALFGVDDPTVGEPRVVPASARRGVEFADDVGALYRMLLPGDAPFHVIEFVALPAEFEAVWEHDGFEAVYVVAGDVQLDLDGRVHSLSSGDFVSYSSRLPHRLRAVSDEVRLLMIECPHGGAGHHTGDAGSRG
jgi:transcriptional regulator with XRE-family HTH domain